ncbi:MAG: AmmeMemoRadiSam system radical SAM enzyme [Candidatus Krumholzibacteriota bacterium]|nr:AmmeMemoRadiSam system radical SAM enzyme [Candidatus Krumholzibacteriota bacterium]
MPLFASGDDLFEASFYTRLEDSRVRCGLCPHQCTIPPGGKGICGVRSNIGGTLYSLVYGRPCSIHIDPIEKKPFFHFFPGSSALSLSTVGCNMSCKFCQNWQISQSKPDDISVRFLLPETIVSKAAEQGVRSIAYTYGEPVVFYEYMNDIARIARKAGIFSAVVSNGYYSPEAIKSLCANIDAIKIDLKSFDDSYYRNICGASLAPVLDTLKSIKSTGLWLEIVYLMVPTLNDDPVMIREMARWLVENLGPDVPVHFSRFYPAYRLSNLPPTPVASLEKAWEICREEGIRYVYIGNVTDHRAENTFCHNCGKKIISRRGYSIQAIDMVDGKCLHCKSAIPGLWQEAKP